MDGLFEQKDHAVQFASEFTALYTNGPAGGGGIRWIACQLLHLFLLQFSNFLHEKKLCWEFGVFMFRLIGFKYFGAHLINLQNLEIWDYILVFGNTIEQSFEPSVLILLFI